MLHYAKDVVSVYRGERTLHPGHGVHSEPYGDAALAYCEGRSEEAAAGFAELVEAKCAPAAGGQ
jgi:hypothetical protein